MGRLVSLVIIVATAYVLDVTVREKRVAARAKARSRQLGKPLLNVGSGTTTSSLTGAKLRGDVNCDIAAPKNATCGATSVCFCDAQDLSRFSDKQFGVALAINVLRYVPYRKKALRELHRVADEVIATDNVLPWPQLGPGPILPVNG
jgi:ubiquinone/menaquinone biosynthesis C-methylase UbiE